MNTAQKTFAAIFVAASVAYAAGFWGLVTVDGDSAWSRFEALSNANSPGRAVRHGDQAIALSLEDGEDGPHVQRMQLETARAHDVAGDPIKAINLYQTVLVSPLSSEMTDGETDAIKKRVASLSLSVGNPVDAAVIIAGLVDRAGDAAANRESLKVGTEPAALLSFADGVMDDFTDALSPVVENEVISGDESGRLRAAENLTDLGGYYAQNPEGEYAAAGLLAAAYRTRFDILGPDHADTIQTGLLLAPVYERIGRTRDAERVYLEAFHAQEKAKGPNNPELSLYIRLLADVYRRQGRLTEAEALNVHMRTLFRDAFGSRRYSSNRDRDRTTDINRPVSGDFPLPSDYAPDDLIDASKFSIPLSKPAGIDEMKIRAAVLDAQTSMPKSLSDLIGACRSDEEKLSLRSGYRSYQTQAGLYERNRASGKVAKPGTSEHQLGLAVDIDVNGRFMRSTDRAYQCFEEQAWRHGFILTYPQGNPYLEAADGFEPWHWRYVGEQTALLYRETGPPGFPQEFLAALPCYQERAVSGLFLSASERDVCLEQVRRTDVATADTDTADDS